MLLQDYDLLINIYLNIWKETETASLRPDCWPSPSVSSRSARDSAVSCKYREPLPAWRPRGFSYHGCREQEVKTNPTDGECENSFCPNVEGSPYLLIPSFLFILIRPCSSIRRDRTSWRSRGSSCYRNQFVICGKSTWESLLGGSVFPKFLISRTFHAPEVIWWWSI